MRRAGAVVALVILAAGLGGCFGKVEDGFVPDPPAPGPAAPASSPAPPPPPGGPATPAAPPAAQPAGEPRLVLERWVTGLAAPIYLTHAGDGSGRVFVSEQAGRIRVVQEGRVRAEPFLDIRDRVSGSGEQGLLGLAFPPDFEDAGVFYVHYSDRDGGDTVVSRFRVQPGGERADAASEEVLLTVDQPYANHNGGELTFGPDGYLYLGLGDGGSAADPHGHGQDRDTLLGKLLRLEVGPTGPYRVPDSNPFARGGGKPEVWAFGLRNPYRFSFDRATGNLFVADVGQREREEVDFQHAGSPGGENYGWRVWEGSRRFDPLGGTATEPVFPVAEYAHDGGHCSVTGGYVYRGARAPTLQGVYLYGDYCSGTIWGLRGVDGRWRSDVLLASGLRISSFGEDEAGDVYVVDHGGSVHRVAGA